jgi:hypothetical protein
VRSREARNVFTRLAELSVHGANVQEGQILLVAAEIGLEERARATAEPAYKRGAKFVDVAYFDPYLKRADPDTPCRGLGVGTSAGAPGHEVPGITRSYGRSGDRVGGDFDTS